MSIHAETPFIPNVPIANEDVVSEAVPASIDQAELIAPVEQPVEAASDQPGWVRRNAFKIGAGLFIGGTAVTVATNPLGHLEKDVAQVAPWAAGGVLATEAMWIGGAAMMAGAAGKKVGNPLTLKSRWGEISNDIVDSRAFRSGLAVNTLGALGTASVVIAGAATALPPETWPGAFGLAAADMASTVAVRSGLYATIHEQNKRAEREKPPKVTVREANFDDIDRLADIDLLLFDKAYGTEKPEKQEVVDMLHQRLANNPGWMFVAEMNGQVEGFVTAFRTNVPLEDFVSWEHSTNNGTLEGKVDANGKYGYVANMTIKHEAVEQGAEDMLLANLFANGIAHGVEYAYFVSRMPHFKRWLEANDRLTTNEAELQSAAEEYLELRNEDGKRYDPQVSMYESYGFKLKRMVPKAFEDDASMDYGVVFKAEIPPSPALKKIKPIRLALAGTLRQVAKHPKLLRKVV